MYHERQVFSNTQSHSVTAVQCDRYNIINATNDNSRNARNLCKQMQQSSYDRAYPYSCYVDSASASFLDQVRFLKLELYMSGKFIGFRQEICHMGGWCLQSKGSFYLPTIIIMDNHMFVWSVVAGRIPNFPIQIHPEFCSSMFSLFSISAIGDAVLEAKLRSRCLSQEMFKIQILNKKQRID